MTSLCAEEVASKATADSAEETTITLGHRRSVGVVVGSIWIRRLSGELVVLSIGGETGSLTLLALCSLSTLSHLILVGLVLSVGIGAAVLLLTLLLLLAVVARMTLRVTSIVGTELVALLAVLEATLLRRTE